MKRRLCTRSNGEMSAREIFQMNDSLADLAIHNLPNGCVCGKKNDDMLSHEKRRSQKKRLHLAIPSEMDHSDPERKNILSAILNLSDSFFSGSETPTAATLNRKVPTVFRWPGDGQSVFVSGSFDNWKTKAQLVRSHTGFMTIVEIPEGTHQYKYQVDGQWRCLSNEPTVETESGFQNNIVTVKSSDCDVFAALDFDSGNGKSQPEDQWTQYIPPRDAGYNYLRAGPPLLPPHLLGTVLNQHMPSHVDPTMLAEPNHVILNHLYTLSIKDGVLVLGSTHRFRRKYITTLLYKPI